MTEPEGAAPATLLHIFTPPVDEPWARCVVCSYSEAAHLNTGDEYQPQHAYRCPYCVDLDRGACSHGRAGAVGLDGKPLEESA